MSYLVLARKYRPSVFSSVSGQEHVTRTLINALKREKVVHAYLLTGPRGVGKTSVARILAKAINCQNSNGSEPCLECQACKDIGAGTSLAVREIDGASHNSVENVRDLMDSFKSLPPSGYKRKVYIIDEVHMLSISAFNALLKSLEEPPPHTVFILATTDVHKIPDTVISRCQRHDFRALSVTTIEARLREVCEAERIKADSESLKLIARMADGSMRDAQTLLDRVQSFCAGAITPEETSRALGTVARKILLDLAHAISTRDTGTVLRISSDVFSTGIDPSTLLREFVHFWREAFVAKFGGEAALQSLGVGHDANVDLLRLVATLDTPDMQDLWDVAREGADRALRSNHPRYGFEALVVRMATRRPVTEIGAIIGDVLSRAGGGGGSRSDSPQSVAPQRMGSQAATKTPAVVKEAAPPPDKSGAAVGGGGAAGFVWEDFISFAGGAAGRVLFENLKRIKPTRCEVGVFQGTAPDFTATSLMRDKAKLGEIFNLFLDQQSLEKPRAWKIEIVKGQGAIDPARVDPQNAKQSGAGELQGHPAVQSLQKIFPGSKVEQVRGKYQ